jgi:hypothetical protein
LADTSRAACLEINADGSTNGAIHEPHFM